MKTELLFAVCIRTVAILNGQLLLLLNHVKCMLQNSIKTKCLHWARNVHKIAKELQTAYYF